MKPFDEQVTPENVEQKIQQVFQAPGQRDNLNTPSTRLIQDLHDIYHRDEAIMEHAWSRLVKRYPEIDTKIEDLATSPIKVIHFPQKDPDYIGQRTSSRSPGKSWGHRFYLLIAVIISLILIGSTLYVFNQVKVSQQPKPTNHTLQLYDLHEKLLYEIDAKNKVIVDKNTATADFINYALAELAKDLHVKPTTLPTMGLKVTTTLDLNLQNKSFQDAKKQIAQTSGDQNITDASVVVLDYHDGSIRSLFGSLNNPNTSSFNAATQNQRQLGDIFKPFVYATAFDQGSSPGTVIIDQATTFPANYTNGQGYMPQNEDGQFHGPVSYRTALQEKYNVPAIQIMVNAKIDAVANKTEALGLPKIPNAARAYSLALGTNQADVLDATTAYGSIANQGMHILPHAINSVTDSSGHLLIQAKPQGIRAISAATAFMISDVLSDKTERLHHFGACSPVLLYTASATQCQAGNPGAIRPAATQAGIDENFRDAWVVGYTTDYVVGSWSGNDNSSPMFNTYVNKNLATQIWHDTMLAAEQGLPIKQFPGPPANVVQKTQTNLGITTTDWYIK
jgi:membrane peptidoglycan carboxypeptidase